eukprot:XP_014771815.1 PREDICTED: uncharacterized protein LOC106870304 [Octopus bimaculoides]
MNLEMSLDEKYKRIYSNLDANETQQKIEEITTKVDESMRNDSKLEDNYVGSNVTELRNGSLLVFMFLNFQRRIDQSEEEFKGLIQINITLKIILRIPGVIKDKTKVYWQGKAISDILYYNSIDIKMYSTYIYL